MGVKFEWRFDEDEHLSGSDRPGQPNDSERRRLQAIRARICSWLQVGDEFSWFRRIDGAGVTQRQHHLRAALARTRPWLGHFGRRE